MKYSSQFRQVGGRRGQFAVNSTGNVAYCVRIRDGGSCLLTSGGWVRLVWSTVQAEFQPHEFTIDSAFVKIRLHSESRDGLPLHLREGHLRSGIVTTGSQSCQSLDWAPIHRVCWWVKVEWLGVFHPALDAWSQPSILKPINYSELGWVLPGLPSSDLSTKQKSPHLPQPRSRAS